MSTPELNDVMRLQLSHASVRQFTAEPIGDDLLAELIRCGQAAASSSFVQAYSVIRVRDPQARRVIAAAAGGQAWIEQAAEFLVFCADLHRVEAACVRAGRGRLEGWTEHGIVGVVDAALMAQNVLLAAEASGLGGVFIGGIRNDPQTVAETLGLPDRVLPVFGMCLGWPRVRVQVKPRLPVATVLHEDRYDTARTDAALTEYDAVMAAYYRERSGNAKATTWTAETARAIQDKKREHMLPFAQARGFFVR